MSEETERLVERIRARLMRAARRMTWAQFAFGAAVVIGTTAGLWVLATLLEASLWLGSGLRTGLAIGGSIVAFYVFTVFAARPLGRLLGLVSSPPEENIAQIVGDHNSVVADRLVNILQLAKGRRSHAPAPYVDRAVQHLAAQIDEANFDAVADFRPARQALRWAAVPIIAGLAFFLAAPSTFLGASERLLAPSTEFSRPAPFELSVTPGNVTLVKGDSLEIQVQTTGTAPENATLLLRRYEQDAPTRIDLDPDRTGVFRHTVPNVREPLRYRLVATPVRTPWYSVDVINRPFVKHLQLEVTPPPYTNRPSRKLTRNVGSVTALPGSQITVSFTVGGNAVSRASLQFEDGSTEPVSVDGDSASATFALQREGSYQIRLYSDQEIPNRDPIRYETSLQSDAPPSVSFLEPQGRANLTPDLTQPLRLQISDDYGIRRTSLYYRVVDGPSAVAHSSFSSFELPTGDSGGTDRVLQHTWLVAQESELDVKRGDEIAYFAKVWDNDTVNGPKSARTVTQRLRFPSLSEQYEELNKTTSETDAEMKELKRQSESVQKQFEELRNELRRSRSADWEDRRHLEQLRKKQKSVEEGIENVSRQVEKMNRQMEQNNLARSETSKKFEELKRAIDEIKSPELKKALQKLRKNMKDQNFPQMQKHMSRAKSELKQREDRIERTLNLLKQLKARQKLEELSRRAQNVTETEKEVAEKTREKLEQSSEPDSTQNPMDQVDRRDGARSDSTGNSKASRGDSTLTARPDSTAGSRPKDIQQRVPSADSSANESLARQQERAAEQMKELMEAMKNAEQEMKNVTGSPEKKVQTLNQKLEQQDIPKKMRKNSQDLRNNQLQKAHQNQQQIQKQLQRMQSQISGMQQQMNGQQRQMNLTGLRSALGNTLELSRNQEKLRTTVEPLNEGPTVRQYASKQQQLSQGLQHVADSLQSIAGRVPRMSRAVQDRTGKALRAMEKATASLDERKADEATRFQKTSMTHLNELALLLSQLLDQMQQQGSGSGGSMSMQQARQQLQKASGHQQKLNQQIQKFLNAAEGNRLSADKQERREQLAEQQRQIKRQLQDMNVGSDVKEQLLGDLEKIAEQMNTSANDLQQGHRSEEILDRQQQILTRLLNAQKSLRTQGKKEEREGRTAESEFERERPTGRQDQDESDTLRRDLIRALEMGYNTDYEELIKRYFELLEQQKQKTSPSGGDR